MKEQEEAESQVPATSQTEEEQGGFNRRRFLGGVGGVTVGALAGGITGLTALSDPSKPSGAEAAETGSAKKKDGRRSLLHADRHHRAEHRRDDLLASALQRVEVARADRDVAPGAHDARTRREALARGGREQVQRELD